MSTTLTWTREKPTQPGWYFFRQKPGEETILAVNQNKQVLLNMTGNPFSGNATSATVPIDLLGGQWAGPLPQPEDA